MGRMLSWILRDYRVLSGIWALYSKRLLRRRLHSARLFVHRRYLRLDPAALADLIVGELERAGAVRRTDGYLTAV